MEYRIVENTDGFEVQKYFEERKQTWIDKFLNGKYAFGWQPLDIHGAPWGISIDSYLGIAFMEKKACFRKFEKAKKFLDRVSSKQNVICEV